MHIDWADRLGAAGLAAAGSVAVASATALPALCPFRVWSGHACPLCGLTRAAGSLITGDLDTSLQYHPMAIMIAAQVGVFVLISTYRRLRAHHSNEPRPEPRRGFAGPPRSALVVANLVVIVGVWIARWQLDLLWLVENR